MCAGEGDHRKIAEFLHFTKICACCCLGDTPGFICTPLVSQNEMQKLEAASLVKKVFGGSRKALFSALLEDEPLSEEEINELRKLIDNR